MHKFFEKFERYFDRGGWEDFRSLVDDVCAKQIDTYSCGLYAVRNLLDLLDHRRPDWKGLSWR